MPRSFLENKRIKEIRYEKIITTSLRLFSEKGYENVTIDMITSEAKVSHGLFYHYFSSKQEILDILEKKCKKLFYEKFELAYKKYGPTLNYLKEINRILIDVIKCDSTNIFYVNLFTSRILQEINEGKEITFDFPKEKNILDKVTKELRLRYPFLSIQDIKNKIIGYLLFIYGTSTNMIKFPNLYINRIEADDIFQKFINSMKGEYNG